MSAPSDAQRMEKIVSLCKRRVFIFQSSEIYGGLNGLWDYGPLGVELKRNLKNYWWRVMVHERDDVVGMDGSILMNRAVWKASGHEDTFSDPMVDCRSCKARLRTDQVIDKGKGKQCPNCGGKDLTESRAISFTSSPCRTRSVPFIQKGPTTSNTIFRSAARSSRALLTERITICRSTKKPVANRSNISTRKRSRNLFRTWSSRARASIERSLP